MLSKSYYVFFIALRLMNKVLDTIEKTRHLAFPWEQNYWMMQEVNTRKQSLLILMVIISKIKIMNRHLKLPLLSTKKPFPRNLRIGKKGITS